MNSNIKVALMKQQSKRNRQLIRDTIHLPFGERISSRNTSTSSSDIDSNEEMIDYHTFAQEDAITLSEDIINKCKTAFAKFDLNNDGTIDYHELKEALLSMGYNPSENELRDMMYGIDQNGDNKLDLIEFLRVIQNQKNKQDTFLSEKEKNEINIQEAWRILSDVNTGTMNVQTFQKTLKQFDLALNIDSLVKAMDIDQNGFVEFDEFHSLFTEIH